MENQQNNEQTSEQSSQAQPVTQATDQKPKRTRKTYDQELEDLENRKQKILEKKRKEEAKNKIIFGATVRAMLEELQRRGNKDGESICGLIHYYINHKKPKDAEIIENILAEIRSVKPSEKKKI